MYHLLRHRHHSKYGIRVLSKKLLNAKHHHSNSNVEKLKSIYKSHLDYQKKDEIPKRLKHITEKLDKLTTARSPVIENIGQGIMKVPKKISRKNRGLLRVI